jgi:hypothetical protein
MTSQPDLWSYHSSNVVEADEAEERNKRPTQAAFILGWLQLGKRVTPMLALQLWGCNRLAARIAELKAEGWTIRREMVEVKSGKRVAEYSL